MPEIFSPDDEAMKKTSPTSSFVSDDSSADLSMGWLLPLLLLVLAAGLFFYFKNGSGNSATTTVAPQFVTPPADTAINKKATVLPDSPKR